MKLPNTDIKGKIENTATPNKLITARKVAALMLAAAIVISAIFLAAPTLRKKSAINEAGSVVITDMRLIPEIIAYYDSKNLATLSADPSNDQAYAFLSDALAKIRKTGGYDSVIFIIKSGKQYLCAADSLVGTGQNIYSPGSLLSPDKAVKNLLTKIYDGKSEGGIASDIVEDRLGQASACVLLPVNDVNGEVIGVLAVETAIKGVPFHIAGIVNLYVVGAVFALIAVLMAAAVVVSTKLIQNKNTKPEPAPAPKKTANEKNAPLSDEDIASSIFGRSKPAKADDSAKEAAYCEDRETDEAVDAIVTSDGNENDAK